MTFVLALMGYQLAAPFIQIMAPDGSEPAIAVRVLIIVLAGVCLVASFSRRNCGLYQLLPFYLFLTFYTLRLCENFFVRGFVWQADPVIALSMLIGSGILPALLLAPVVAQMRDGALINAVMILSALFLTGLGLNWELLMSAAETHQASLEKLNPISLGAAGTSLGLVLAVLPGRTRSLNILRYALIIFLFGAAAATQARGPIVATAVAMLVFGVLSKGPYRKNLIRLAIVGAVLLLLAPYLFGVDVLDFALKRFFTDTTDFSRPENDSAWLRKNAWHASWEQFLDSPIIGDKVFEPTLMHYPHNLFLESLIALGLLGTLLLVVHLLICARGCANLISSADSSGFERAAAMLWTKEFVAAQFSASIWGNSTFIILSASLVALTAASARRGVDKRPPAFAASNDNRHRYLRLSSG